ncbi:SGNH/GDSL hydrolase family protein [Nocardia bovistercoris]|uniref:SGNH/GDSL hydrolase family protein n=1 Tax=Nocardia bovistercoris TaxID=2785916 RepID=A0A931I6D3_9NOCA|nr:SGNH/GDSL hydrolase family protein [Nocardia bovistercoris]MBH0774733.1 SGNH/GDSL hydrolase family protein [Nocardia bovistercoris]
MRSLVASAALCVAMTGFVAAPATAAPSYDEYVALGDSWAADATFNRSLLTTEFVPPGCAQRISNFARQVAAALSVTSFRDAACAGATTADMTAPQPVERDLYLGTNTPQFDRLTPDTDLVTILIGGNDAGLAAAVRGCITPDPAISPCRQTWIVDGVDRMSQQIAAAEPKVTAAVAGIRQRSPAARILMLDYFEGVAANGGCWPTVPVSPTDADWLAAKLVELDAMLARVAERTGVQLVDTYAGSAGHDACQPPGVRWAEGLVPYTSDPPGPAVPFHPNQLGVDYQARSVLAALAE